MTLYTATITLILVMDPLGNVPIFLSFLRKFSAKRQNKIILRESAIAFVILALFLFSGSYILKSFGITQHALNISGGIILFIIALRMIFPATDLRHQDEATKEEPFIVPLAIPLTAGPATLATVLLFASQEPDRLGQWFLAILIASIVFTIILLCSRYLMRILGQRGLTAMERLMGMILTTVAVQMFLSGLSGYFQQ